MSQVTGAIVLNDGQATPVAVSFYPEQVTPAISTFVDRASGIATQYRRLSIRFDPSKSARADTRAELNVSIPVSGTLPSGATGILRTLRATMKFQLPDGCTDAERKDLFAFAKNALANALVTGVVRDYDPLY